MQLRNYQQKALGDAVEFIHNDKGNGIISLPCGAGKSIVAAKIAEHLSLCHQRPIIIANRAKLLDQNASKLSVEHGVLSAGLKRYEYDAPILIAGIQTAYNKSSKIGRADWLLIDEAQHVGNDFASDTMYHQFIRCYPNARIIGLTATPFRTQEGQLSWGRIIHETTYSELWEAGYLAPLTNKLCDRPDLSEVDVLAEDYNIGQLNSVMNKDDLVIKTAQRVIQYTRERNKVLIFCVSVDHAISFAAALHGMGEQATFVHGNQTEETRKRNYDEFEHGNIKFLCNVELATIGLDFPCIDCIVSLRPTKSLMLHEQMLGRGVRIFPNKKDCLILDFAGNLAEHGNLGNPVWKWFGDKKVKTNKNNIKSCPSCEQSIPIFSSQCPSCNYVFLKEEMDIIHNEYPDTETDLEAPQSNERWYKPTHIIYSRHGGKNGKPDTLKINYVCGKANFYQFLCFDHSKDSWAYKQAAAQAKLRGEIPDSIEKALEICESWKKPKTICVKPQERNPQYKEICNYEW